MRTILRKITNYKNWFGKFILWVLGLLMILSQNYPIILKGFLLTDLDISIKYTSYTFITGFGLLFIVSGVYLNKFLDMFLNKFMK